MPVDIHWGAPENAPLPYRGCAEDMIEENQAAILLAIENPDTTTFLKFRTGARTRAVMATQEGVAHRFQEKHRRVVVKLYKGKGDTSGSQEYQHYHQRNFQTIRALTENDRVQQSVAGGVMAGVGPYAVVQYIEGEELAIRLERTDLTRQQASQILREILELIWIPLWNGGLRFKDCHAGNFVLTPNMRVVMIDTEQMRKGVSELILTPTNWTQRNKHQEMGLKRLHGLIKRVVEATGSSVKSAAMLRQIKASLNNSGLAGTLALLGKHDGSIEAALRASNILFNDLTDKGLIE